MLLVVGVAVLPPVGLGVTDEDEHHIHRHLAASRRSTLCGWPRRGPGRCWAGLKVTTKGMYGWSRREIVEVVRREPIKPR